MIVTYWGVRGSVPVPGPATVGYGGNTACVSIRQGDSLLVLDAGTGIVELGRQLDPEIREVLILLSHRHGDHVQGLPFFAPLYRDYPPVGLLDLPGAGDGWTPLALFDGVFVPILPDRLGSAARRLTGDPLVVLRERGWEVDRLELRHPGGASGFRIAAEGRTVVHLTDTELDPADDDDSYYRSCVEFCRGADLLSHDAQYLAAEMEGCRGRGHSSVECACDLAATAGVGRLVLFHHDPRRADAALVEIEGMAAARLGPLGIPCAAAREGMSIEV